MNRSIKLAAGVAALLAATFVVIKAANAETHRQGAPTAVASTQAPEADTSPALPTEQD